MRQFGTALILSGGKSRRMGFDKQLLQIRDRNIIDHIISQIRTEFDDIVIASNRPELYADTDYHIVPDQIKGMGPLSGIHVGLLAAKSQYVYVIACDMPNVNLDYVRYMKEQLAALPQEVDACITCFKEWIEPFNSFYNRNLIEPIEQHFAENKKMINTLLKQRKCHYISEEVARTFSPDWAMFLNLNTQADLAEHLAPLDLTTCAEITKVVSGTVAQLSDAVIVEYPLTLFINGEAYYTLYCTPQALSELVYGYLFAEGIINCKDDVMDLLLLHNQHKAFVTLLTQHLAVEQNQDLNPTRRAYTGPSSTTYKAPVLNYDRIMSLMRTFNNSSDLFKQTGAVHSCAIANEENDSLIVHEDIGRHNALDKIVGTILLEEIPLSDKMLLTSGRITQAMLKKAAKIGFKKVISRSAPTSMAIELARELGITLVGFVRGSNMNIYT